MVLGYFRVFSSLNTVDEFGGGFGVWSEQDYWEVLSVSEFEESNKGGSGLFLTFLVETEAI